MAPIMLLRNLDQTEGLWNGTKLIVTGLTNHVIKAKIITGDKNVHEIYIYHEYLCDHYSHHGLLSLSEDSFQLFYPM